MRPATRLSVFVFLFPVFSCIEENVPEKSGIPAVLEKTVQKDTFNVNDLFSAGIADGFILPVEKQEKEWDLFSRQGVVYETGYHAGENWRYKGKQTTNLEIVSAAKGEVIETLEWPQGQGKAVLILHRYLENAQWKSVYSVYSLLDELKIKKGDNVEKNQVIGLLKPIRANTSGLHFEIRKVNMKEMAIDYSPQQEKKTLNWITEHYEDPSAFIRNHSKTFLPAKEKALLIVVKHSYQMQLYNSGKLTRTYDIALSQSPLGHKQEEGDNKLPEGEYRIIQKTKGPFAGDYSEYLGPRFMRLNYPNNYDAANALKNKKITAKQAAQITAANNTKKEPNKHTGLGGGIGIHGWAGDWPTGSRHLTWGCISMKNEELPGLFDEVPLYTQILIFP